MFDVAHVFIHTFTKLILPLVCIEQIDLFGVPNIFNHTISKLILGQPSIE